MTKNATTDGPRIPTDAWRQQADDSVTAAKEKVASIAGAAVEKFDDGRSSAADSIQKAAAAIRDNTGALPSGRPQEVAQAAAEQLHTAGDYVRSHDVSRMKADVESLVRNNPGPSLLVAAVFGFLIGRTLTRD